MFALTTRNGNRLSHLSALDRLVADLFEGFPAENARFEFAPPIRLTEDEAGYRLRADLPGVAEKDVHLEYENGILTLRAERRQEETEKEKVIRNEHCTCTYVRSFELPEVDADKVRATLKDGILDVTLPKSERAKPRQIKIN
jgi:HSP20 family protein